jgi:hypothetical protein
LIGDRPRAGGGLADRAMNRRRRSDHQTWRARSAEHRSGLVGHPTRLGVICVPSAPIASRWLPAQQQFQWLRLRSAASFEYEFSTVGFSIKLGFRRGCPPAASGIRQWLATTRRTSISSCTFRMRLASLSSPSSINVSCHRCEPAARSVIRARPQPGAPENPLMCVV